MKTKTKSTSKLENLTKKLQKTIAKKQKQQAKETDLKVQIDQLLAQLNTSKAKVETEGAVITLTRNENYSIPKAAITDIQTRIPENVFANLFNTSYRLNKNQYESLSDTDSECKKVIKEHLIIKPAPLSVRITEK